MLDANLRSYIGGVSHTRMKVGVRKTGVLCRHSLCTTPREHCKPYYYAETSGIEYLYVESSQMVYVFEK